MTPSSGPDFPASLSAMLGWFDLLAEKAGWTRENAQAAFMAREEAARALEAFLSDNPSEPRPCPFCGGAAQVERVNFNQKVRIGCQPCGMWTRRLPFGKALSAWNGRSGIGSGNELGAWRDLAKAWEHAQAGGNTALENPQWPSAVRAIGQGLLQLQAFQKAAAAGPRIGNLIPAPGRDDGTDWYSEQGTIFVDIDHREDRRVFSLLLKGDGSVRFVGTIDGQSFTGDALSDDFDQMLARYAGPPSTPGGPCKSLSLRQGYDSPLDLAEEMEGQAQIDFQDECCNSRYPFNANRRLLMDGARLIREMTATPAEMNWEQKAARCANEISEGVLKENRAERSDEGTSLQHLKWMSDELAHGRVKSATKACRWLGYLQAGLIYAGLSSLEQEKRRNERAIQAEESQ